MVSSPFYRNTWAEINLDHIYENVSHLRKHLASRAEIMAVVKANGYGHGAVAVAKTALAAGATRLAVALLDEALLLREADFDVPILVMGWIRPQDAAVAASHKITVTAFQLDWFQAASESLTRERLTLSCHLKLDSGMGRIGLTTEEEAEQILQYTKNDPHFDLEGAYTHFATADAKDQARFLAQYERFNHMIGWLTSRGLNLKMIHSGNSATGLRFPDKTFQAVRFGISMYGLSPASDINDELPFPLKQAFTLHSKVVHVKKMNKGEPISYGGTYETKQDEWIGTLPIGYADGWTRKLQGAAVLVNGQRCPIVGRICMDQLMVRLPGEVPIGTKATLIGKQGSEEITVDDIAHWLDTINYEIPCMISYRVPRMFSQNKRIIEV